MKYLFVECGCCGGYHAPDYTGDCRDDAHRYTPEQMEAWHGTARTCGTRCWTLMSR